MADATSQELFRLERALAVRDHDAVEDGLATLLDDDFLEFGASGRVWTRESTVAALDPVAVPRALEMTQAAARELAPGVVLLTYTLSTSSADGRSVTRRASIWRRRPDGWRVVFHQGTPAPEPADP